MLLPAKLTVLCVCENIGNGTILLFPTPYWTGELKRDWREKGGFNFPLLFAWSPTFRPKTIPPDLPATFILGEDGLGSNKGIVV